MSDEEPQARDVLAAEEFAVGSADPQLRGDMAHDVLAADAFEMGSADPDLSTRRAHDVLAAEEFGVPAPDPALRVSSAPIRLPSAPGDPGGSNPPRDVLAAEEFAVPGSAGRGVPPEYLAVEAPGSASPWRGLLAAGAAGLMAQIIRRRSRTRAR